MLGLCSGCCVHGCGAITRVLFIFMCKMLELYRLLGAEVGGHDVCLHLCTGDGIQIKTNTDFH